MEAAAGKGEAVKQTDWAAKEAKRFGLMAAAFAVAGVLHAVAHQWLMLAGCILLALLYGFCAFGAWAWTKVAQPWDEAKIRRPRPWEFWFHRLLITLWVVSAFSYALDGRFLEAAGCGFGVVALGLHYRGLTKARRLTERPPKPPARVGPPMEWID